MNSTDIRLALEQAFEQRREVEVLAGGARLKGVPTSLDDTHVTLGMTTTDEEETNRLALVGGVESRCALASITRVTSLSRTVRRTTP